MNTTMKNTYKLMKDFIRTTLFVFFKSKMLSKPKNALLSKIFDHVCSSSEIVFILKMYIKAITYASIAKVSSDNRIIQRVLFTVHISRMKRIRTSAGMSRHVKKIISKISIGLEMRYVGLGAGLRFEC